MTPERLEELLRTRPSDVRTYNRELPDLAMRRSPVLAGGLRFGWAAAVLVVGLVVVIGASSFGPWQHGPSAAKPSAACATAASMASWRRACNSCGLLWSPPGRNVKAISSPSFKEKLVSMRMLLL